MQYKAVKCKGCGKVAFLFLEPVACYEAGSVGHSKPPQFVNVPNTVQCSLYNQLTAEEFFELHKDAEPFEQWQNAKLKPCLP